MVASSHPDTARGRRPIAQKMRGMHASDGAGVRLTRMIGTPQLDQLDPFLLFDVFHSDDPNDYIAGFPDHPHRGFETVTYMLAGNMRHRDSVGNEGVIRPGGVQWMTAARGIVHSEMPEQQDGLLWGTQLWVNLPASDKMGEPAYHEFDRQAIPVVERAGGVRIAVVAGSTSDGTTGPVRGRPTEPLYFDIGLPAGGRLTEPVPPTHHAFLYVIEGEVAVGGEDVSVGYLAVLGEGDRVEIEGRAGSNRVLLIAGRALDEPVARSGPFVMNTRDELLEAYRDFQSGRF